MKSYGRRRRGSRWKVREVKKLSSVGQAVPDSGRLYQKRFYIDEAREVKKLSRAFLREVP